MCAIFRIACLSLFLLGMTACQDGFTTPEQRADKARVDKLLGYDAESKRHSQIAIEAVEKEKAIVADADAHPEKYDLTLTDKESRELQEAETCVSWAGKCYEGQFSSLRQVVANYYDMIFCENEKIETLPCTNTDLNHLYYMLTTGQKREFIDNLVARDDASDKQAKDRIENVMREQFKGQYHLVRIMSHYYEQPDANFPQIDPQMALAGIQTSPEIQNAEDCTTSAKQSIKKRWWSGLMHGGKQVSENTIIAPFEGTGTLVVESYICVPAVQDHQVSSIIEDYTHELLSKQMGTGISTKEFIPAIPGL